MLPNRTATAAKPPTARSALTNNPRTFGGLNGNTAQARRFRDLLEALLQQLGNPTDPIRQAEAVAAASAMVIAEDARAKALRGEPVDLDALVRLENTASRAFRKLGRAVMTKAPTLAEYSASRKAAAAGAADAEARAEAV
jgi:hypothetical protein